MTEKKNQTDRKRTRGRTAEKQERTPSDDQSRTERKSRTGQKSTTGARPKAGQQAHARLERRKGKSKPRRHTSAVRELGAEIRLNKFLAEAGVAARRKADELIASGVVRVNGKVVTELGSKVNPHRDEVSVRGTPVYIEGQLLYILMNKPKDCITTTSDEKGRRTVMDLIPAEHHVYPVGRLDRNTTGALLLTNDGDLANQLMHPRFHVQKTYVIELTRKIKPQDIQKLRTGIRLEDGLTAPCEAEVLDTGGQGLVVGIVLHEGRNRQVRRMFESLGYEIRKLDRVAYAGLTLSGLRRGSWRYLEDNEVGYLRNLAARQRG
ncbi:MAG: rRNA pseudouridine synthase [Bacteroidetes bacterium]|nr:rRNA pseudouridine synthase [Bacteroidota bacterium]